MARLGSEGNAKEARVARNESESANRSSVYDARAFNLCRTTALRSVRLWRMRDQTSPTLHVSLEKPPQAFSLNVRKVLTRVAAGEIRVPDFQRPLRWKSPDVVKLFDSILRGYPIGSLLFWKRPLEAEAHLKIGGASINVPASLEGWLIVDGQQRTTALAAALLELDHAGDMRWVVRFDPEARVFLPGPPTGEEIGRHVPLAALGDIRRLSRWFRDCRLDEASQDWVEEVQQRILDYEIPAYLMDTENGDALRGVFARLNSTGVRMRPDEVFHALLASHSGGRDAIDLSAIQEACDLDGFGQPPRPEVLKAVLAMSGLDPSRRLEDVGEEAASDLVSGYDATEALRRMIAFLQASPSAEEPGAGIPAYAFIPYPIVFVLLARWFHLYPETDAAMRRDLSRWLWRGVLTGVHQRAAVSAMRRQVRKIVVDDAEASLEGLLTSVGVPEHADWTLGPFHAGHAASRAEILALLARGPRDKDGLVSWRALLSDGQRVAREIFASAAWKKLHGVDLDLARSAANRILLDARHTGLSSELKTWDFDRDGEILESHMIGRESFEALLRNDVAGFLRQRSGRLRLEVSAFLAKNAGLGEPRLRPLAAYLEPLEATSEEVER